jgi:hypothetical protein
MGNSRSVDFSKSIYKAAQNPRAWLCSAERLRDAADIILRDQQQFEVAYFRAHEQATQEALTIAYLEGSNSGTAEIRCRPPNYPPAQLLYAYAIENLLKGLIVAKDATLINADSLAKTLRSHNLRSLCETAGIQVFAQEEPVLKALSELSTWAGRYPVAIRRMDGMGSRSSDELLDWGSQHPILRRFFDRALAILENRIGERGQMYGSVVVFRQPGT